jgi:hypothetical protein
LSPGRRTVTSIWVLHLYCEGTALYYFTLSSSISSNALLLIKIIYRICCQRSFEELFPGRSALFSFLNADFGLFFLPLCLLSSLFYGSSLTIDVESLFERFHSVTFQYSPLFTPSVICMLIVIHLFFRLLLACVPKTLFSSQIESILLRARNESFHIIKNCMNKPLCSIFKQFQRTGLCFILKLWSVLLLFWENRPKLDIFGKTWIYMGMRRGTIPSLLIVVFHFMTWGVALKIKVSGRSGTHFLAERQGHESWYLT